MFIRVWKENCQPETTANYGQTRPGARRAIERYNQGTTLAYLQFA
jgi:hypothetical protein